MNLLKFTNSLSFIVPVKDVPINYLKRCLKSIFDTVGEIKYEIVIFNDGSNVENSKEYEVLIKNLKSVHYLKSPESKGISFARNSAIKFSSGKWIVLVDGDDVLERDFVKRIKPLLITNTMLIYADHCQYDNEMKNIIQIRKKRVYHELYLKYANTEMDPLLWSTFIFHPQIFNRFALEKIGLFNEELRSGDEVEAHIMISEMFGCSSIKHVPYSIYKYRKNIYSVVHDKDYYSDLILNIESILSKYYLKRTKITTKARRVGRCVETGAAHYRHYNEEGNQINLPYFDFEKMMFLI